MSDDIAAKTRPNRNELECDDLDYSAIQRAIAMRMQMVMPDGDGNTAGRTIAEICRGWMEFLECSRRRNNDLGEGGGGDDRS